MSLTLNHCRQQTSMLFIISFFLFAMIAKCTCVRLQMTDDGYKETEQNLRCDAMLKSIKASEHKNTRRLHIFLLPFFTVVYFNILLLVCVRGSFDRVHLHDQCLLFPIAGCSPSFHRSKLFVRSPFISYLFIICFTFFSAFRPSFDPAYEWTG